LREGHRVGSPLQSSHLSQKLSGEARKSALAQFKGWSEVKGRDAARRMLERLRA